MDLLPLEISQHIVDMLTHGLGLYDFLMLRCVSEPFDRMVVDTISRGKHVDFENQWKMVVVPIAPTFLTKILKTRLEMDHERKTRLASLVYGVVELLVGVEGPLRVLKGQYLICVLLEELGRAEFYEREVLDLSVFQRKPPSWTPKAEMHAAFIVAAATGDIPTMKRMFKTLSEKEDPIQTLFFNGALDAAAFRGQLEATRLLLEIDKKLHYHSSFSGSQLYVAAFRSACYAGNAEIVNIPLGGDYNNPNYSPDTLDYVSFIVSAMEGQQPKLAISLLECAELNKLDLESEKETGYSRKLQKQDVMK